MIHLEKLLNKKKRDLKFKKGIVPEINQKSYQSQNLMTGKVVKITKNHIYFDIGFKALLKTKKKKFINTFFKIETMIRTRHSNEKYDIISFLKSVIIGKTYKLMVYQIKSMENGLFVDFNKTLEYAKYAILFYELETLKNQNKDLKGYILNSLNGGFSVALGGLVAFIPNNEINKNQKTTSYQTNRLNSLILDSSFDFKILNINFNRKNVVLTRSIK